MTTQQALAIVFASLLIVGVLYAGLAPPNGPPAASPRRADDRARRGTPRYQRSGRSARAWCAR